MSLINIIAILLVLLSVLFAIFIIILFIGIRRFQKESLLDQITKKLESKMLLGPDKIVHCQEASFNLQARNYRQLREFEEIKPVFREGYKKIMTKLEFERFVSYLREEDLQKVDLGIKGLDGLADPRAIPKLDEFIEENKDKKEFGELVERAKSVRDRIIDSNR